MSDLHLETVTLEMRRVLTSLMQLPVLDHFRLVGGTALALQLGHRRSVDLDFFTDLTTDFQQIKEALQTSFSTAVLLTQARHGQTWSIDGVKCDFFDWKVPFLHPPLFVEDWRLATLDDIAAYKLEAYADRKSEKDFRDIAEILRHRGFEAVLSAFRKRYPFIQTGAVLPALLKPEAVVRDATLQMLNDRSLEEDAQFIQNAIQQFEATIAQTFQTQSAERDRQLRELIERRKKE